MELEDATARRPDQLLARSLSHFSLFSPVTCDKPGIQQPCVGPSITTASFRLLSGGRGHGSMCCPLQLVIFVSSSLTIASTNMHHQRRRAVAEAMAVMVGGRIIWPMPSSLWRCFSTRCYGWRACGMLKHGPRLGSNPAPRGTVAGPMSWSNHLQTVVAEGPISWKYRGRDLMGMTW